MPMTLIKVLAEKTKDKKRLMAWGAALWLAFCLAYITIYNGWKNLFSLLPHEFFIVLLIIAFPIGLAAILIMIARIVTNVETMKSEMVALAQRDARSDEPMIQLAQLFREHRDAVAAQTEAATQLIQTARDSLALPAPRPEADTGEAMALLAQLFREHRDAAAAQTEAATQLIQTARDSLALPAPRPEADTGETMALLAQLFREHRDAVAAQLEAQTAATAQLVQASRDSRDGIVDELRSQRVLSQEITHELSHLAQSRAIAPPVAADPVPDPSQRIDRMRALAEILGLALNDLSMTATQVLTEHLNAAHGDKEGTRKFITTLTTAYFAGDKNVFFRSLVHEVVNSAEQLRRCAADTDIVRQQISKILREAREIRALVSACDPNDLVRIVFEDGELWALEKALAEHFAIDGTAIAGD